MNTGIYSIAVLATAGVIFRPFKLPEAVFAIAGALALLAFRLISPTVAWAGVLKGADVYFFLIGMMLLAETAREEQVFKWLAAHATQYAKGSPKRLFLLVYIVGTIVTAFLSNDATAVVLTPAVAAAASTARIRQPLPFLFICAFIANAASFLLPISNPANLVMYGSHMPPLLHWLSLYFLPSLVSISLTYWLLYLSQKKHLRQDMAMNIEVPDLTAGGRLTLWGLLATTVLLLIVSAADQPLGLPTAIAGVVITATILIRQRRSPSTILRQVSWSVLPLVAGLFVIVEALDQAGAISGLSHLLQSGVQRSLPATVWTSGTGIAVATNLANNLPIGLISAGAIHGANAPELVKGSLLIGVDLGPNLSVTGSLATILWLTELRREGVTVNAWQFLRLGVVVMIPALLASLLALILCTAF
jgi:arsenical pump membrane protein